MSFSTDFKSEIIKKNILESREEKLAFISAVFRQNGSIHIIKKVVNIEVESEFEELIFRLTRELKELYDFEITIKSKIDPYFKKRINILELPPTATKIIAQDTGMIVYCGDMAVGFSEGNLNEYTDDKLIKAYLLGIAVSSANITVPNLKDEISKIYEGGYSLEMRFYNEYTAYSVMNYFAEYDILLKKVEKTDSFALYIRDSEMISDFMAFFGGSEAVLKINDIMVERLVRNTTNRIKNFELANIDKSVEAGQKQYLAIKLIDEKIGLNSLSDKLRQIALIRLENPDYTLEQIAEEVGGDISKSGINHRFRKIIEIAKALENKNQ